MLIILSMSFKDLIFLINCLFCIIVMVDETHGIYSCQHVWMMPILKTRYKRFSQYPSSQIIYMFKQRKLLVTFLKLDKCCPF